MISRSLGRGALAVATAAGLTASAAIRPAAPAHAAGAINIGLVADLTGAGAAYGISIANGAKLAGSQLNKVGGVDGSKVNVIVDDGATNTYHSKNTGAGILGPISRRSVE